ncbi:MAG: hypothetical protein PHY45_10165 [Rhodocyclaceae bacterium]|nr:hypothetical protein [Rhodocyclaceae bacterium]
MTTESIDDPMEKEDKLTAFVPDISPNPNRFAARKHEGETHEEFIVRQKYIDMVAGFFRFAGTKDPSR